MQLRKSRQILDPVDYVDRAPVHPEFRARAPLAKATLIQRLPLGIAKRQAASPFYNDAMVLSAWPTVGLPVSSGFRGKPTSPCLAATNLAWRARIRHRIDTASAPAELPGLDFVTERTQPFATRITPKDSSQTQLNAATWRHPLNTMSAKAQDG